MFANTSIWPGPATDLGTAFEKHIATYRGQKDYALGLPETCWLNAVRDRALSGDPKLQSVTGAMLDLLAAPAAAGATFKDAFLKLYDQARRLAYPLSHQIIEEHRHLSGFSRDYTLGCFDVGQIRLIEEDAVADASLRTFADEMLRQLQTPTKRPRREVYRQVFDIYSEALICRLLRERCGPKLTITKIAETNKAGPDFACQLRYDHCGEEEQLDFFIEVKSLDIADAPQRLPEMLDEAMDVEIELERQRADGRNIAIAEGEIAPHRRYGSPSNYDHRSIRQCVETLIDKASGNFKNTQFQRGPTFALANLLRLPPPPQGVNTLAPVFYDPCMSGACISGALWHMAFGSLEAPIYRWPDFEGSGTTDGNLGRAGLLVDPAVGLRAAGLILLHEDQRNYRIDGLYDASWTDVEWGWSNLQVEQVLDALCGDYNNRRNEYAHKYSRAYAVC